MKAPHKDSDIKRLLDQFQDGDLETLKTFEASNSEGMVHIVFGNLDLDFTLASITGRAKRPNWSSFWLLY